MFLQLTAIFPFLNLKFDLSHYAPAMLYKKIFYVPY